MVRHCKFKNVVRLVCIVAVLLHFQCKQGNNKITGDFVVIDVSQKYPAKEFYLQDMATLEYIPLETNDKTLMRSTITPIYVSDNYIITSNQSDGDVFVFDGKGKSKFSFNHKGQGPMEYNFFGDFAFDEKAKEIFVFDRYSNGLKIQVYNEDGRYKRTLTGFSELKEIDIYNFDDETLLVYDKSGVMLQGVFDQALSYTPYLFMSKTDGSIVDTLSIQLPIRVSNASVQQDGDNILITSIFIANNRLFGKNFLIADWSSDTIYRLTPEKELQPMIIRKPPIQETEPKTIITNFLATEKFILCGIYVMDYSQFRNGGNISKKQWLYNFDTGQINECAFKNRDITSSTSVSFQEATTPANVGVTIYDASFLIGLNEKGDLKGDLKDLLKSLDAEDNPVLLKITF